MPLAMGRPVWVDDPHFNLGYHVRRTALPSPGGEEELRNLVGRIMSQQLDRAKPLWEMWMAEGLGEGRWALVSKVHHCMVDGVSGTDLLTVILDKEREPAAPPHRGMERRSRARAACDCWRMRWSSARSAPTKPSARSRAAPARAAPARPTRLEETTRALIGDARPGAAHAALLAQRADRPAPPLELGALAARPT